MATGVGFGFDLSFLEKLKDADKLLEKIYNRSNQIKASTIDAFKQMSSKGVVPFVESLKQQKKMLEEIGNVKVTGKNRMFDNLQKDAAKTVDEINKVLQALQKTKGYRSEASGRSAISFANKTLGARGDKSIDNLRKALAQLEAAQNRQNLNTKTGQKNYEKLAQSITRVKSEIDKVTGSTENLKKSHSKLLDTSGQLARAMAAVFSVSAIKGYVNKLMQIRGEFELQQRSLQVLLQNKDEANALWDKTVALAVKSPYTTKQLVTATKQLAAYRIESEKLYETNKMLADVSIGLGVDMNRLILAFGQVKAANFLRGTELRQFSEAGVNMLDELAKRFTMLEGRAVSVGEVFERVSKRMVSFKDVEAVFKTITSEGGTFYQMQEKQSETLKGMMLNLKDSYELMLNDIGKSNEGMLKGFVSFMKIFVDGWREAAVVIKTAGTAMLFYFAASKIAKIGSAFSGLWAAMAANPVGAIAAGVGVLIGLFVSLYQHTNKLNEALLEVEKNVGESLEESIGLYRKLTDTINDSTASLDERNKAYEELKTKFKDILPDQQLELEYIQGLSFNYKKAEDAMFAYYNAKAIQQKKDKIESIYEGDFSTDEKELISGLRDRIENSLYITDEDKIKLKAGVAGAVSAVVQDLKSGKIAADFQVIEKEIEDRLFNFSGVKIDATLKDWWGFGSAVSKVFANLKDLAQDAKGYTQAMLSIKGLSFQTYEQMQAYNAMQEHNKEMENAVSLYKHLVLLRQKLADNKVDLTSDKDSAWYLEDLQYTFSEIDKLSPDVANGIKEIDKSLVSAAQKGSYEFAKSLGVAENALYNIFADKAKTLKGGDEGASAMLTNFAEGIKANAESKLATPLQQAIISAFDLAIKERDIDQKGKDLLAKLLPDSKQTTEDVRKSVEALLKQYQDDVKKWENATAAGATKLPFVEYLNQFGNTEFKSAISQYLGSTEEFKDLEQKMIPVLEHIHKLLGGDPDKDKKGRSNLVDERLRVIKEIYKAYKELNKTFDETTSKTGAMEKFGDAFNAAFGKTPEQMGYNLFTAEGVVDAYNKFIETLSKADDITKGNLAKGEFVMELQVEMQQKNDKAFNDQIEKMFSGYELAIELDKLNVPRDFAEQLFGVDTFDLSTIRTKIEDELYRLQTQGGGQDQIKKMEDFLKKVDDMELKDKERRLKELVKYMREEQDIRIKLKLEEINKLKDIEESNATEEQKNLLKSNVKRDYAQKLKKAEWDEFAKTPYIVQMFDNLDSVGTRALEGLSDKLKTLKDDLYSAGLPASELKEILDKINNVENELNERKPFRGLGEGFKNVFGGLTQARKEYEAQLKEQEKADNSYKSWLKSYNDFNERHGEFGGNRTERRILEQNVAKSKKDAKDLQERTDKVAENYTKAAKSVTLFSERTASAVELTQQLAQSAIDVADSFGAFSESGSKEVADSVMGILSSVDGLAQAGIKMASGDWLGGITSAVTSIAQLIIGINQTGDAMKQMEIEKELKSIKRLQKAYEDLEEAINNVYDLSVLQQSADIANKNIEEQIKAQERMIALEEDKKKSDQDAIDARKEEIEDLKKQQRELNEQVLEEKGGFGSDANRKSTAEAFVDAWLQAYKETGDGLSGLNDQFDEFYEDFVKKQLLLQGSSKYLNAFFNQFDSEIDKLTQSGATKADIEAVANNINDIWNQTSGNLDAFLASLAEALNISETLGTTELGGLQAGIQGITTEQADVLAAYMNSIRFFVADSNMQLKALVAAQGIDTDVPNPMLAQLMNIAESVRQNAATTDAINDLLNRVKLSTNDGTALKVRMV